MPYNIPLWKTFQVTQRCMLPVKPVHLSMQDSREPVNSLEMGVLHRDQEN